MNSSAKYRESERGSAGAKFLAMLGVIVLVAHAGYNYIPVAYDAESIRADMSTAVLQGLALPGKVNPVDNVKSRIQQSLLRNQAPPDATLEVKQTGNVITAHVAYNKPVRLLPFGFYTYNYRFDNTATPTGFLVDQAK